MSSCHQYTGPTHFLDLPLSLSAKELGLHNHWLPGEVALTKHLIVTLIGEERRGEERERRGKEGEGRKRERGGRDGRGVVVGMDKEDARFSLSRSHFYVHMYFKSVECE